MHPPGSRHQLLNLLFKQMQFLNLLVDFSLKGRVNNAQCYYVTLTLFGHNPKVILDLEFKSEGTRLAPNNIPFSEKLFCDF